VRAWLRATHQIGQCRLAHTACQRPGSIGRAVGPVCGSVPHCPNNSCIFVIYDVKSYNEPPPPSSAQDDRDEGCAHPHGRPASSAKASSRSSRAPALPPHSPPPPHRPAHPAAHRRGVRFSHARALRLQPVHQGQVRAGARGAEGQGRGGEAGAVHGQDPRDVGGAVGEGQGALHAGGEQAEGAGRGHQVGPARECRCREVLVGWGRCAACLAPGRAQGAAVCF